MRNWAGNVVYRARQVVEPGSVEELQELVRAASSIRAIGSRHSFSDIADTTGDLVSLAALPRVIAVDPSRRRVTVDGGIRYGELCGPLDRAGFALRNLASLPHISVAGACATGTHGSGVANPSLSAAVTAIDLVRADGELVTIGEGGPAPIGKGGGRAPIGEGGGPVPLAGSVVALGALGVVARLTLEVEPAFRVRQHVFLGLDGTAFRDRFGEIVALGDSVSCFTTWSGPSIDQVWVKRRVGAAGDDEPPPTLAGATPATRRVHPIRGAEPEACTPQLGEPGPWHERLPHFRMEHTPSSGDELQSEYFVGAGDAVAAFDALDRLRARIAPLVQVSEIRTVAADELWLSPAYRRPSVTFHFTWRPDWPAVRALLPAIEAALEPFEPRPHWGKLSSLVPAVVRSRYARLPDAIHLARRLDPDHKFGNEYLERLGYGPPPAGPRTAPGADARAGRSEGRTRAGR